MQEDDNTEKGERSRSERKRIREDESSLEDEEPMAGAPSLARSVPKRTREDSDSEKDEGSEKEERANITVATSGEQRDHERISEYAGSEKNEGGISGSPSVVRSERKRIRERERRSELNDAFNQLADVLHSLDSRSENFSTPDFDNRHPRERLRLVNAIKNRVDLVNHAIKTVKMLQKENSLLKLEMCKVQGDQNSSNANLLLGISGLANIAQSQHNGPGNKSSSSSTRKPDQLNHASHTLSTSLPENVSSIGGNMPRAGFNDLQRLGLNQISSLSAAPSYFEHFMTNQLPNNMFQPGNSMAQLHALSASRKNISSADYAALLVQQNLNRHVAKHNRSNEGVAMKTSSRKTKSKSKR